MPNLTYKKKLFFGFETEGTFSGMRIKLSSRTRLNVIVKIIVNEQPECNGHFCWRCKLASPAAEV